MQSVGFSITAVLGGVFLGAVLAQAEPGEAKHGSVNSPHNEVSAELAPPEHGPTFQRDSDDNLILRDESCAVLETQAKAILAWTRKLEPHRQLPDVLPVCHDLSGSAEVKINTIVPTYVRNFAGKRRWCVGPNCFNKALQGVGLLSTDRFVDDSEIKSVIESPICRGLSRREPPEPGDLVVIGIGKPPNYMHAFIYLSDRMVYEKPDTQGGWPDGFVPLQKPLNNYIVKPGCFPMEEATESCPHWARAYRCDTQDEFLKKTKLSSDKDFNDSLTQVEAIDREMHGHLQTLPHDIEPIASLRSQRQDVSRHVEQQLERLKQRLKDGDRDLSAQITGYELLRSRLKSLELQTGYLTESFENRQQTLRLLKLPMGDLVDSFEIGKSSLAGYVDAVAIKISEDPGHAFQELFSRMVQQAKSGRSHPPATYLTGHTIITLLARDRDRWMPALRAEFQRNPEAEKVLLADSFFTGFIEWIRTAK